jgi:hypothetical protein
MPLIDLTEQELADAIDLCENPAGHLPASDPISVAAKLLAKLRNSQAQVWEPVPMHHSWDGPDADYGLRTASISDDRLYIETESDMLSIGLPSDYRLCRLVSQEREP